MRIIDFHGHFWVRDSLPYINADPEAEEMLRQMDKNGIEWSVLHAVPKHVFFNLKGEWFIGDNEDVLRIVKKHPDRLIGSVYINPLDTGAAIEDLKRYHGEGFKCVKMAPYVGFYPDDPACDPVFEAIDELGLPVMFHCGSAGHRSKVMRIDCKCGHPIYLHNVSARYPDTKFVVAHLADIWFQEAVNLCSIRRNIYLETSTQGPGRQSYQMLKADPRWFRLKDRVMWGHDNDPSWYDKQIQWWVDFLEETGKTEFLDNVFCKTACEVLGLPA
ncbi:MAG: amidohydrolase family protein [Armatimonadetes bacterium]|nr:amidohydrolase family protein [Armatimonadota bacterium]